LITASASSAWSYGGAILTFVFPELLFIAVAAALYVLYTKPHLVPGHHYEMRMRATSHTTAPTARDTPGQQAHASAVDTGRVTRLAPHDSDNEV
jgi:hypothetical protein